MREIKYLILPIYWENNKIPSIHTLINFTKHINHLDEIREQLVGEYIANERQKT